MNPFLRNLQAQAETNPHMAIALATAAVASLAKLIDAVGHAKGSRAYAKQVNAGLKRMKR